MDFYYSQNKEQLEKELFEKVYQKQMKANSFICFLIFLIIGSIFFLLGLGLTIFDVKDETDFLVGIPFLIMGGMFLLLSLIVKVSTTKVPNYEKYKKRLEKYGYLNTYDSAVKIALLEEKLRLLEEKVEELERRK